MVLLRFASIILGKLYKLENIKMNGITPDNTTEIEVQFDNDTVCLTQQQMAVLLGRGLLLPNTLIMSLNRRSCQKRWLVPFRNIPLSAVLLKGKRRRLK